MKCAIIIADGIKQIMFTPENESEKMALKMITIDDDIIVEVKEGTLYDGGHVPESAKGYVVSKCQGGYLRAYPQEDSLMLVLRRREVIAYKDLGS